MNFPCTRNEIYTDIYILWFFLSYKSKNMKFIFLPRFSSFSLFLQNKKSFFFVTINIESIFSGFFLLVSSCGSQNLSLNNLSLDSKSIANNFVLYCQGLLYLIMKWNFSFCFSFWLIGITKEEKITLKQKFSKRLSVYGTCLTV